MPAMSGALLPTPTQTLLGMSSLRLGVARAFDAGNVAGATNTSGYLTFLIR